MMSEFLVEMVKRVVVVRVQLDRATLSKAGLFRDTVMEIIQSGSREIIIDCRNIEFMDSTFLGALVVTLKKMKSNDGGLRLVFKDKTSPLWLMFETTRMFNVFEPYFSIDDAIESFNNSTN